MNNKILPGFLVACGVATVAFMLGKVQFTLFHAKYLDEVLLAIVVGGLLRVFWIPADRFQPGIRFSVKIVLELAIVLLGVSLDLYLVLTAGSQIVLAVLIAVITSLTAGYAVCRILKFSPRMSLLVASGTAICGNSAIAAVGTAIGATAKEITSAISFTAILGVIVIAALPFTLLLGISQYQYGVLAGLTVYAVPQVLAATAPIGVVSVQVGTFVKLLRVITLGPTILITLLFSRLLEHHQNAAAPKVPLEFKRIAPWFIIGFFLAALVRTSNILAPVFVEFASTTTHVLTLIAMAALGLSISFEDLRKAGFRLVIATSLCQLLLVALSFSLVVSLGFG